MCLKEWCRLLDKSSFIKLCSDIIFQRNMQVVYSGGSTPTPSPRLQRKQIKGYGRPVLPGYFPPTVHHTSTPRSQSKEREKEDTESSLRDSIPAMMKPVAIMCLIFNIIIPGLGRFTYCNTCSYYSVLISVVWFN